MAKAKFEGLTDEQLLEQATAALDENEQLTEKVTELQTQIDTLNAEKATAVTEKVAAEEKATQAAEQITTLTESVNGLNEQVATLTADKTNLEEQVVSVRTSLHEAVAKHVAYAKMFSGKIAKEQVDQEVESLKVRTDESLNDSLSDIIKEFKIVIEKVENPAPSGAPASQEKTTFEDKKSFEESISGYLSQIIRG